MNDLDNLLSIVENPTRRRILEALVREPHYPLQLSKELGVSQQAIMKNLVLMEQNGMVVSYRESSNMGPQRTLYVPNTEFTIVIDMHNRMFTTKLIPADCEGSAGSGFSGDLEEACGRISELDEMIERLDRRRSELIRERNAIVEYVTDNMPEDADYDQRRSMYNRMCVMTGRADNPSDDEIAKEE